MKKAIRPPETSWPQLLGRPVLSLAEIMPQVQQVFTDIREQGDRAVKSYTEKFDGVALNAFKIPEDKIRSAEEKLDTPLIRAIRVAKQHIETFHIAQQTSPVRVETMDGVVCWQEKKPIEKVGLYIPGGSAPLFSSVLMLAVPAKLAGCKEVVLCSPPGSDGEIHPAILFAAGLCGVDSVYAIGGIQAIAAMTFGTETVPAVYKIFGPGNQYVTAAKQLAIQFGVGIDMPAGPSELMVIADDSANPRFVAADLLSQAEHGPDSQVVLVCTSESILTEVESEIDLQIGQLDRKSIAEKALGNSLGIVVDELKTAVAIANEYAAEHLILNVSKAETVVRDINNAGSVFLGNYTPESAGDYASGTNHTLPTNGYARQYSGVNLDSFLKSITYQQLSPEGLLNLGETIAVMAEHESLMAHKRAVTIRMDAINKESDENG